MKLNVTRCALLSLALLAAGALPAAAQSSAGGASLFITPSELRMQHMMELATKTGLGNAALFTFIPEYAKKAHPYKPAPQLLMQHWYRGNGQPFSLLAGK